MCFVVEVKRVIDACCSGTRHIKGKLTQDAKEARHVEVATLRQFIGKGNQRLTTMQVSLGIKETRGHKVGDVDGNTM